MENKKGKAGKGRPETMATTPRAVSSRLAQLEKDLTAKKEALMERLAEQRSEVFVEREPEDECGEATRSLAREMALSTVDREQQTLLAIENALRRIQSGEYGVCENCGQPIAEKRLSALPWTRVCIRCAELASAA